MGKSFEEKLEQYEELLKIKPTNENVLYLVAFYYEKKVDELAEEEGRLWSAAEINEAIRRYKKSLEFGYKDAEKNIEKLKAKRVFEESDIDEDKKLQKGVILSFLVLLVFFGTLFAMANKLDSSVIEEELKSEDLGDREATVYVEKLESEKVSLDNASEDVEFLQKDSVELLVLRSAVYQFTKKEGRLPYELEELKVGFPNNYLTDLPLSAYGLKNNVVDEFDGEGGWLYMKPDKLSTEAFNEEELKGLIEKVVLPNFNHECSLICEFKPIELIVDKKHYKLSVLVGDIVLKEVAVGLGKDDNTPLGVYEITKKIVNPNQQVGSKSYGTRAMELSNSKYAIHGTYVDESIGANMSNGCVRVGNVEIEALYAVVPLGTKVSIVEDVGEGSGSGNGDGMGEGNGKGEMKGEIEPYFINENMKEELKKEVDLEKIYGWLE